MGDLSRRDMLKGVLGSSVATWILSQHNAACAQPPKDGAESLSVEITNRFASQRLAQLIRPRQEEGASQMTLDRNKVAWSIDDLGLPYSGEPIWKNRDIYDIHGQMLFRDKTRLLGNGTELRFRTAASPRLITPVWQAGIGPPREINRWMEKAKRIAGGKGLRPVEGGRSLVCYCYPKLGLLCNSPEPERKPRPEGSDNRHAGAVVIDLVEANREVFRPIPINNDEVGKLPRSDQRTSIWSPFDTLKRVDGATERFVQNAERLQRFWQHQLAMASLDARAQAAAKASPQYTLHIDHEMQQTPAYCAAASGVMLLGFHNIQKTQDEVASCMKADEKGCAVEDQVAAYAELSKKGMPPVQTLEAVLDEKPTPDKSRVEILEHRRPFKVGTDGHARVVSGWCKYADGSQAQLVYDPYTGDSDWSDEWDVLLNFIYLQPKLYG